MRSQVIPRAPARSQASIEFKKRDAEHDPAATGSRRGDEQARTGQADTAFWNGGRPDPRVCSATGRREVSR